MKSSPQKPVTQGEDQLKAEDQRKALAESEKHANRKQPENYKEEETEDKVVEIGPDVEEDPIKGIDPPEQRRGGR
jgi:hypothetical protein